MNLSVPQWSGNHDSGQFPGCALLSTERKMDAILRKGLYFTYRLNLSGDQLLFEIAFQRRQYKCNIKAPISEFTSCLSAIYCRQLRSNHKQTGSFSFLSLKKAGRIMKNNSDSTESLNLPKLPGIREYEAEKLEKIRKKAASLCKISAVDIGILAAGILTSSAARVLGQSSVALLGFGAIAYVISKQLVGAVLKLPGVQLWIAKITAGDTEVLLKTPEPARSELIKKLIEDSLELGRYEHLSPLLNAGPENWEEFSPEARTVLRIFITDRLVGETLKLREPVRSARIKELLEAMWWVPEDFRLISFKPAFTDAANRENFTPEVQQLLSKFFSPGSSPIA